VGNSRHSLRRPPCLPSPRATPENAASARRRRRRCRARKRSPPTSVKGCVNSIPPANQHKSWRQASERRMNHARGHVRSAAAIGYVNNSKIYPRRSPCHGSISSWAGRRMGPAGRLASRMAAMRPPVSSLDAGQAWLLPPLPTEGGRYVFELPASAGALLLFAFRPIPYSTGRALVPMTVGYQNNGSILLPSPYLAHGVLSLAACLGRPGSRGSSSPRRVLAAATRH
jgi:hypothetical protein